MDAAVNVYLVRWDDAPYDAYDAMVVIAKDEKCARWMHPYDGMWDDPWEVWAPTPDLVTVTKIGTAEPNDNPKIVLVSFNAW